MSKSVTLFAELERRRPLRKYAGSRHLRSWRIVRDSGNHATTSRPAMAPACTSSRLKYHCLLSSQANFPAGRRCNRTVSIRAIPATITRLVGLSDAPFDDAPLVSPAAGKRSSSKDSDASVLATLNYDNRNQQTVIFDLWQYIKDLNSSQEDKKEELYDLERRPRCAK